MLTRRFKSLTFSEYPTSNYKQFQFGKRRNRSQVDTRLCNNSTQRATHVRPLPSFFTHTNNLFSTLLRLYNVFSKYLIIQLLGRSFQRRCTRNRTSGRTGCNTRRYSSTTHARSPIDNMPERNDSHDSSRGRNSTSGRHHHRHGMSS